MHSALFSTRGNGCDGSIVTGVSSGSTSLVVELQRVRARSVGELAPAQQCGSSPRAARAAAARSSTRTARRRTRAGSRSAGPGAAAASARPRPERCGWLKPSSIRCSMPATRISTNSSRLLAVIARNFTRSSNGLPASSASSSTRWLKSIQDSSRSKNSVRSPTPCSPAGAPAAFFFAPAGVFFAPFGEGLPAPRGSSVRVRSAFSSRPRFGRAVSCSLIRGQYETIARARRTEMTGRLSAPSPPADASRAPLRRRGETARRRFRFAPVAVCCGPAKPRGAARQSPGSPKVPAPCRRSPWS